MLEFYTYWRSSCSFRVRAALYYKGLVFNSHYVNLLKGEQHSAEFRLNNPQGFVPYLIDGSVQTGQSLAILEYLEERYKNPPLLPDNESMRARIRAFCLMIVADMQPLMNLRVLKHLKEEHGKTQEEANAWVRHFLAPGLSSLENILSQYGERYCFGNQLSMADFCLLPQVFGARRFETDLSPYPKILEICNRLEQLECFILAWPENQPDAPKSVGG